MASLLNTVRRQQAVWVDLADPACWDLPLLVAHRAIDSIRIVHGGLCRGEILPERSGRRRRETARYPGNDGAGRWSQEIYFHLLNCGLRIPPTAASAFGVSPNPVGYNRVHVKVDGPFTARPGGRV